MPDDDCMTLTRSVAVQALSLSVQDWKYIGSCSEETGDIHGDSAANKPTELDCAAERITSLLLVRIIATNAAVARAASPENETSDTYNFKDLSTSNICRVSLVQSEPWDTILTESQKMTSDSSKNISPKLSLETVREQLLKYVKFILQSHHNELPFHNFRHAYHVVASTNKIMESMLSVDSDTSMYNRSGAKKCPPAFGLRHDPLALQALIYAALIHDVDHGGVTNRQRVIEGDEIAMLYNDQSVQEQRSLQLSFEALLKDEYKFLYRAMFPAEEDYHRFRRIVVESVLSTDIASPERAQLSKSKWKEAFGETSDQADVRREQVRRSSIVSNISMPRVHQSPAGTQQRSAVANRRGSNMSTNSAVSEVTTDSSVLMMKNPYYAYSGQGNRSSMNRRMSNESGFSAVSDYDSVAGKMKSHASPGGRQPPMRSYSDHRQRRRASNGSMFSDYDSVLMHQKNSDMDDHGGPRHQPYKARRRASNYSVDSVDVSEYACDSVMKGKSGRPRVSGARARASRRWSTASHDHTLSLESIAAESIGLAQKRGAGHGLSRPRPRMEPNSPMNAERADAYDFEFFDDDEDDSSLSLTPPSSDDEQDGVIVSGTWSYRTMG